MEFLTSWQAKKLSVQSGTILNKAAELHLTFTSSVVWALRASWENRSLEKRSITSLLSLSRSKTSKTRFSEKQEKTARISYIRIEAQRRISKTKATIAEKEWERSQTLRIHRQAWMISAISQQESLRRNTLQVSSRKRAGVSKWRRLVIEERS